MRYFEKGHTYHGVKMPETVVWTETEYVIRTIIAWLILLFLAAIFIGGPIMLLVCMYWTAQKM